MTPGESARTDRTLKPWLTLLFGLAVSGPSQTAVSSIDSGKLSTLMMPLLSVVEEDRPKVLAAFLSQRRLVLPDPALLVFFDARGCVTAVLKRDDMALADDECLRGEALPGRSDFLAAAGLADAAAQDAPRVVVFSPYFEVERLRLMLPDAADRFEQQKHELAALVEQLRSAHSQDGVVAVAVRL